MGSGAFGIVWPTAIVLTTKPNIYQNTKNAKGVKSEENIGGNFGGAIATYLVERAVGRVADHDLVDAEAVLQVESAEVHDLTARG